MINFLIFFLKAKMYNLNIITFGIKRKSDVQLKKIIKKMKSQRYL